MKNSCFILVIFIVLTLFTSSTYSQFSTQYKTENVFIVAIDGLRYTEGFASGNTYIPFLWDSLAPKGTIYTNFYNTGVTTSNSGHSQITNGVRQLLLVNTNSRNLPEDKSNMCPYDLEYSTISEKNQNPSPDNISIDTDLRPTEPTVGEYYRKFKGAPKEKVYYINGHSRIWRNPVSLFPGYGPDYAPVVVPVYSDLETLDTAFAVIERDHPPLCYVLFGEVDAAGHSGDTTRYLGQIMQVDSLIFQLWQKIQSDSVYANKTTMIITTDHGRHDEQHGGWKSHGDQCGGCRHVFLIALGPDIKPNTIIEDVHDHVDIAPTVGELLNFPTPLAQGKVLNEMLVSKNLTNHSVTGYPDQVSSVINLSRTGGFSRSPSITKNNNGLHVVFSDNNNEKSEIYYTKSTNSGTSWSSPQIILTDPNPSGYELEPAITSVDSNSLYVISSGYHYSPTESTYLWLLKGILSENSGLTWNTESVLDTQLTISSKPTVVSTGKNITAISTVSHSLKSVVSTDGGLTFSSSVLVSKTGFPQVPTATYMKSTCYSVWQNVSWFEPYWKLWFGNQPWLEETAVTPNVTDSYPYFPSISSDNAKRIHLAYSYAYIPDSLAPVEWRIDYLRSLDSGKTWQNPSTISGLTNSFLPKIKISDNGKVCAIWSSFTNNKWSIRGSYSTDAGVSWVEPFQITQKQEFSLYSDFYISKDTLFVVWQNFSRGNWELLFTKYVLNSPNEMNKIQNSGSSIVFSLAQNYPNPFNPKTNIRFQLPKDSFVSLKIFDLLGTEVSTLINEEQSAGIHDIDFNASDLPSGIYFYRIQAGNFIDTKKLILLK